MTRRRRAALPTRQEDGSTSHNWSEGGEWLQVKESSGLDRSLATFGQEEADVDPVLKTYDVFVSNTLQNHLYLLQYPIRNREEQYTDESAPLRIRMKQNRGDMEFDVPIDTQNYSSEQGEKFGGQQHDFNSSHDSKSFDRQRLSGKTQPNQASYFIGRMRGDQMHLSPVRAVVQLRPNFHYYDTAVGGDRRKKFQGEEGQAKALRSVQVQMRNADDARDPRYPSSHQSDNTEEFVSLSFVDTLNPETVEIADKMLCPETSREYTSTMNGPEFLCKLLYTDDSRDTHTVVKTERLA